MPRVLLGNPRVESVLLPRPVEALRGVRVGSIAAADLRNYALADTGKLWAWAVKAMAALRSALANADGSSHAEADEVVRGVKVDAVAAGYHHTLALADDKNVYAWGSAAAPESGALGLGPSVSDDAGRTVPTPQRIPALRVVRGL
jgi:alpha-tubulin suppressor-like RCC1 family protein